jgi:hypothetical protein
MTNQRKPQPAFLGLRRLRSPRLKGLTISQGGGVIRGSTHGWVLYAERPADLVTRGELGQEEIVLTVKPPGQQKPLRFGTHPFQPSVIATWHDFLFALDWLDGAAERTVPKFRWWWQKGRVLRLQRRYGAAYAPSNSGGGAEGPDLGPDDPPKGSDQQP